MSIACNATKGPRLDSITFDMLLYMIGFLDGDGEIVFENGRVRVRAKQSSASGKPEILRYLWYYLGGSIILAGKPKNENQRQAYQYTLCVQAIVKQFLYWWSELGVIKNMEAKTARDYILTGSKDNWRTAQQQLRDNREARKDSKYKVHRNRMNWIYLSGLFDAEGSVGVYTGGMRLCIAQSSCPNALEAIREFWGTGCSSVCLGQVRASSLIWKNVLTLLLPWSIVKKEQILVAIDFLEGRETEENTRDMLMEWKKVYHCNPIRSKK